MKDYFPNGAISAECCLFDCLNPATQLGQATGNQNAVSPVLSTLARPRDRYRKATYAPQGTRHGLDAPIRAPCRQSRHRQSIPVQQRARKECPGVFVM
jgi:hypothetical protein